MTKSIDLLFLDVINNTGVWSTLAPIVSFLLRSHLVTFSIFPKQLISIMMILLLSLVVSVNADSIGLGGKLGCTVLVLFRL